MVTGDINRATLTELHLPEVSAPATEFSPQIIRSERQKSSIFFPNRPPSPQPTPPRIPVRNRRGAWKTARRGAPHLDALLQRCP